MHAMEVKMKALSHDVQHAPRRLPDTKKTTIQSYTGFPRKNATDLNNSNGSCFILVSKQLFLLKSAIIRINFDIFSSVFGDLVVKLIIRKLQNCLQVKTRAAALAIVD